MSATRLSPSRRREAIRAWWAAHMKAHQDSGQSQVAYCRARCLNPKYFTLWKRKLREPRGSGETIVEPARLVPVVLRRERLNAVEAQAAVAIRGEVATPTVD